MKHAIFFAVTFIVIVLVLLGLMTDEVGPAIFSIIYGGLWWLFFKHTRIGRKMFRIGYRIAYKFMNDADV